jgi:hypothetical protein
MVEQVEIVDLKFPFLEPDGFPTMTTQLSKSTSTTVSMDIEFLVLLLPTALVVVVEVEILLLLLLLLLLKTMVVAVVQVLRMEESIFFMLDTPRTSVSMPVVIKMVHLFKSMVVGMEQQIKDGNLKIVETDGV